MYKLSDIKEIHLETTNKCQAKCPMCPRRIYGGPENPLIHLEEVSLQDFKDWFPEYFLQQLDSVFMCGNLGDPIIAHDTLAIFEYLRNINPTITLSMHTNGSARNKSWWEKCADLDVRVVFGIDGLEESHKKYRINTDWNLILKNAKAFIDRGGRAEWHMLVFQHNEHEIEDCRLLSENYGFEKFEIKHTSRFQEESWPVLNDEGKTIDTLYPSSKSLEIKVAIENIEKNIKHTPSVIQCKAVHSRQIYVSANGLLTPCCWLDFSWVPAFQKSRIDYMDEIGYTPSLKKQTLEEIFDSDYFQSIAEKWNTPSCLVECKQQCGAVNKRDIQFANT